MRPISAREKEQFAAKGVVKLAGLVTPDWLDQCRECYDWVLSNPTKHGGFVYDQDSKAYYNDASSLAARDGLAERSLAKLKPLAVGSPLADAALGLFAGEDVWYYDHEVFTKRAPKRLDARTRSPFHQDTG